MTWTLTFNPSKDVTIGDLTAVWNAGQQGEFTYTGSVNVTDEGSVADFISTANKLKDQSVALAGKDEVAEKVAPYVADIEARMNK